MICTMTALTVPVFGPADGTTVLALHGITGHGRRWTTLANDHLPELRIVAPDLLGHGHSSWDAPWTIEAQVAAIVEVLDTHADGPVVVVGHSFGGALAIHLSRVEPSRVAGLVLLDPAIGLDGAVMSEVAAANLDSWYLRDEQDARERKRAEAWWEVPEELLDAEIAEHLHVADDGRMSWRVHLATVTTTWSELARPYVLPAPGIDVRLVVADKVQPPYAPAPFITDLTAQQGERFILHHEDCDHMVPLSRPELTARLIRDAVASVAAG